MKSNNQQRRFKDDGMTDICRLKSFVNDSALNAATPIKAGKANQRNKQKMDNSPKFKTMLCNNWTRVTPGYCKYGRHCKFAHGPGDLRCFSDCPTYKTKLCKEEDSQGLCPYIHATGECFYLHRHELAAIIQQALNKLGLADYSEELLLPYGKKLEKQSEEALQNIVKELLRFVRHQQQDMTISTVAPTTYLQSLRHNHQKPNVMLNDGSVHRSIPSPRTPPPSAHARAVSPPASNSYTTPFTFNFSNEKAASISHAFGSPRHQRDAQLRALSTETEKLRSKLAFLEQKQLMRAQQLWKCNAAPEASDFVSKCNEVSKTPPFVSKTVANQDLDVDVNNDWLHRRADESNISQRWPEWHNWQHKAPEASIWLNESGESSAFQIFHAKQLKTSIEQNKDGASNIFQRWRNEKEKSSGYSAVDEEKEKDLFRELLSAWTKTDPKNKDENNVTLLGSQKAETPIRNQFSSFSLYNCVPRAPQPHHSAPAKKRVTPPLMKFEDQSYSVSKSGAQFWME